MNKDWITFDEACRLAGLSDRQLRRRVAENAIRSRKRGRRRFLVREDVEVLAAQRNGSTAEVLASPVLHAKRERVQELLLDTQKLRAQLEYERLRDEQAERGAARKASQDSEKQARTEERERARRAYQEKPRKEQEQQHQREWMTGWCDYALSLLPEDAPAEINLQALPQVKRALAELTPDDPYNLTEAAVRAAVEEILRPWRAGQALARHQRWLQEQKSAAWHELCAVWRFESKPDSELRAALDNEIECALGGGMETDSYWSQVCARASVVDHVLAPYHTSQEAEEKRRRTKRAIETALSHVEPFMREMGEKRFLHLDSNDAALLAEVLKPKVRRFLESRAQECDLGATEMQQLIEDFILEDQRLV